MWYGGEGVTSFTSHDEECATNYELDKPRLSSTFNWFGGKGVTSSFQMKDIV